MSDKRVLIALAGNPNTGKTTIFNALTGSHQRTGNWPGVTVERKEGRFHHKGITIDVVDLPGTYSLSSYTIDERIARDFIMKGEADLIVVILDASNLERNLYLVVQLLELEKKVVCVLNMIDTATDKGIVIDYVKLSDILGCPFIPTVAVENRGIDELKDSIIDTIDKSPPRLRIDYGDILNNLIDKIIVLVDDGDLPYPPKFTSLKYIEGDPDIVSIVNNSKARSVLENIIKSVPKTVDDIQTSVAEARYGYIHGLYKECVKISHSIEKRIDITSILDKIFTNRYLGIPTFFFAIWLTFQIIFIIGNPISNLIGLGLSHLSNLLDTIMVRANIPSEITSLIIDGIIPGIGAILVFVPNIFLLFAIFSALEDSGYLPRGAFVMDKLMHALGLHGKSFIPLLLGFGCNVPAIMSTRIIESRKDRILTILINPLMSCSARLPIYLLFAGVFFAEYEGWVVFSLYLIGVALAIIVARLFKSIYFRKEIAPLIMELPPYRLPRLKTVFISSGFRTRLFLRKAGTIIFAGIIIVWLLASLPTGTEYASENTILAKIGKIISPIFSSAGFGFWQAGVSLLSGIVAKEAVVGTLGTMFGKTEGIHNAIKAYFTPLSAYAFMVMSLIYTPCLATIAVIRKEIGIRWALIAIGYSLILGWTASTLIYQIGRLFYK
ncbi:MAG: ferrous iron transport protein B [bacterium]